ncbi:MAG: bifunctional 4-hydroxy-2-oxoglutarate aldolase/2-dehydro-3-deoxy-phosphogluconate aldolase [Bacilli bacterium]|nr:bifunctional 4-hydroxy-2-oxoglutarate aldolase/2-dehydro-3-deoxy-phosphogluconate aldolase [Bacilli bacterium]
MSVLETISKIKLVPVVVLNKVEDTLPVIQALHDGDVPVAEICFRTDCAAECIRLAVEKFPNDLIGAGTVINAQQCEQAIDCGAKFIVSPGLSDDVARVCKERNIPYLPGIVTPTEIMRAIDLGLNVVKFFPAGVFGGLKAINAMGAAFPAVKFMPTGGVDNSNLKEFVENKKIVACGGSWLVKGTPEDITRVCLEARKIIKGE